MRASIVVRRSMLSALILSLTASVGLSQVGPGDGGRTVTRQEALQIEQRVARMPPVMRVEAQDESAAAVTAPSERDPQRVPPDVTAAAARPQNAELQLIRPDAATEAQLNRVLVAQAPLRQAVARGGRILPLPGIVRQLDESGGVTQLKAFVLVARRLAYDAGRGLFVGSIRIGVSDIVPRSSRDLGSPITFSVIDAEEAEPSEVQVVRTNALTEISVRVAAAPGGGATIRIASDLAPDGTSVTLPLMQRLSADPANGSIEAWGLAATDINISVTGLDQPAGRAVTLRATSGYLSPTRVRLDDQGNATATLRSDQLGVATIMATSPGLKPAQAEVDFRLPHRTAIASLFGAFLGAMVRLLTSARSDSFLRSLLAAVLAGILIFACYAIGVNLLPFTPSVTVGLAFVFAVSGVGAYFGNLLLDRTIKSGG